MSEQGLPGQRAALTVNSQAEISVSAIEVHLPVIQMEQQNTSVVEAMMRQDRKSVV